MSKPLPEETMNPFVDKYALVKMLEDLADNTGEILEYMEEHGESQKCLGYTEGKHLTALMLMLAILEGEFDAEFEDEDEDGGGESNVIHLC
jgi:hypothetical protein